MTFIIRKLSDYKAKHDGESKGIITGCFKGLVDIIYYPLKAFQFLGDLILMHVSRQNEYRADTFARGSGFGTELAGVLNEIYGVSVEKPKSVKEQMTKSHPHITLRIERLEKAIC